MKSTHFNWVHQFPKATFPSQTVLLEPSAQVSTVYAILDGLVKMVAVDIEGKQVVISLFNKGTLLPLPAALLGTANPYFFESITQITVAKISVEQLKKELNKHPQTQKELFLCFLRGFTVMTQQITALKSNQAEEKIIVVLKQLIGKACTDDSFTFLQALTQQDIADLAGVSRETVSRKLSKLLKNL